MLCPSCKTDNPSDATFCEQCGSKLELICPAWEVKLNPGSRFCRKCGTAVGSVAPAPVKKSNGDRIMISVVSEGPIEGQSAAFDEGVKQLYSAIEERLKRGTVHEYKRLICFDRDLLEKDHELQSGILRVGKGPGTIGRQVGEHCRFMIETKGCSLYVAPTVFRGIVTMYGTNTASMSVETADEKTGARSTAGVIFFYDPPNGEIIEQLRQIERVAERRMVAVRKIVFPEDSAPTVGVSSGSAAAR